MAALAPVSGLVVPDSCEVFMLQLGQQPPIDSSSQLSPDEQRRAHSIQNDAVRWAFIATRVALRGLLGERLGLAAPDVKFATVGRGKPVLAGTAATSGLRFNVAHADGYAVIAMANQPVGVDVEVIRPEAWDMDMAALVLSPHELAWVRAQHDRDTAFFVCWTRKEAWAKMGDLGLIDQHRAITLTPRPEPSDVRIVHTSPSPGVVVALAYA